MARDGGCRSIYGASAPLASLPLGTCRRPWAAIRVLRTSPFRLSAHPSFDELDLQSLAGYSFPGFFIRAVSGLLSDHEPSRSRCCIDQLMVHGVEYRVVFVRSFGFHLFNLVSAGDDHRLALDDNPHGSQVNDFHPAKSILRRHHASGHLGALFGSFILHVVLWGYESSLEWPKSSLGCPPRCL